MKTSVLFTLCAVLASAAATSAAAQEKHESSKRVFFKDVTAQGARATLPSEPRLGIYNGDVAGRTQFPYQAGIYVDFSAFCGGSLIHRNWVLTAAHCVDGFSKWAVFLGVTNMLQAKQEGRVVHISNVGIKHEDYDSALVANDIAVIQLRRQVELSEFIQLAKLAPANTNYAGMMATASGFGKVGDTGAAVISPVLKFTSLPVVSFAECYNYYGSYDKSQICVSTKGSSICQGDSGGPLTVKDSDGSDLQIGLTSFGCRAGCTVGCPVGFARINIFYDWLSQKTGINFPLSG